MVIGMAGSPAHVPERVVLGTHGDHRLAMTWYLAGELSDVDVELDDSACVRVSWPDFFADIESLKR